MQKRWLGLILGVGLVGLGAVCLALYDRLSKTEIAKAPTNDYGSTPLKKSVLPKELTSDFNPTVNAPTFKLVSVGSGQKSLKLKMIFPEEFMEGEITSVLTCPEAEVKIMSGEQEIGSGSAALFKTIAEKPKNALIFRGLCSDLTCQKISRQCVLYLM